MENLRKGILVKNGVAVGAVGDKYFSSTAIGVIQAFSGNIIPRGFLVCDGASYKVADYPDLYAVIGNTYGGDTENFNVPNLIDKFIQGSTTVQPPALTMVYIIKAFHTNEGVDSGVSDDVINYIETKLVDLGGREQSVTFPFTPTANGTLILTIGQKSVDPVARAVNVIENGEPFYSINNYFGASWGASSASIPLVKGKTYTVEDPDDVIMYEKTKFIY